MNAGVAAQMHTFRSVRLGVHKRLQNFLELKLVIYMFKLISKLTMNADMAAQVHTFRSVRMGVHKRLQKNAT